MRSEVKGQGHTLVKKGQARTLLVKCAATASVGLYVDRTACDSSCKLTVYIICVSQCVTLPVNLHNAVFSILLLVHITCTLFIDAGYCSRCLDIAWSVLFECLSSGHNHKPCKNRSTV